MNITESLTDRIAVSPTEAAKLLGLSRNRVYEAIRNGEIPYRRFGRRILLSVRALQDWALGGPADEQGDAP